MTTRARRPTDETETGTGTSVYAPASWDHDATEVNPKQAAAAANAAPAVAFEPGAASDTNRGTSTNVGEPEQATPTHVDAMRSEPIRVISMKDRAAVAQRPDEVRIPLHVQLRSMAEVAGVHEPPSGLGHLAPPRDPAQSRRRRQRDNVVWAGVAIALACAIALGIWLIAGR